MDRVDILILAGLALFVLSFLLHQRWRRGRVSRIERINMRRLRLAIERGRIA